jgi:Ca-activated chloride channel homolog
MQSNAARMAMALALFGAAHAGAQDPERHDGPLEFEGGGRGWISHVGNGPLGSPSYGSGRIFSGAGFTSSWFVAFAPDSGDMLWGARTSEPGPTAALVEGRSVVFATESCTIFAYDGSSGRERWHRYLGDPLMSQPAVSRTRVFSSHGGHAPYRFASLALSNGRTTWRRPIEGDVLEAPVLDPRSVYFTTTEGVVYKFDQNRGRELWHQAIDATSAPWVSGDSIYVARRTGDSQEQTVVLAVSNGEILRELEPAPLIGAARPTAGTQEAWGFAGSRPVVIDQRIYQAIGRDVQCRDAQTGALLWNWSFEGEAARRPATPPAVAGGQVVFGTVDGALHGLDRNDGHVLWRREVGEPIVHSPIVVRGWVYATTIQGAVVGAEIGDETVDGWYAWGGGPRHVI